jgi:EAL domain-containing protein (putative c-di-GMP-specific phosphodiesterase class I)
MYHAKQSGRQQFHFFSPAMNAHVVERIELEQSLRIALMEKQFELQYQPGIDIISGRPVTVEALLRWRHPTLGLLLPEQFMAAAERIGLMVPIGEWVLREACWQARRWREQGHAICVSVNLSAAQFMHPNLLAMVDSALHAAGLQPSCLELEITEAVIMHGNAAIIDTVGALRARGLQVTVDNFGTGYTSLKVLRRVPLSKLKIDRSFIGEISRAPHDAEIIPAIIAVARSLHMQVVAEGVETKDQLQFLRTHGCDQYQGFYYGGASTNPDLNQVRN